MFTCINCKKEVQTEGSIGTRNRNHCPYCLYSVHLDKKIPGDRESNCKGIMEPIGLTQKKTKTDRYGKKISGEVMIVHKCKKCGYISTNRIAGDDDERAILEVFEQSLSAQTPPVNLLGEDDREELERQLFGK